MTRPADLPANPAVESVSAFFPCFNDAESIGKMVREVHHALELLVEDFEVVVVNDGSTDASAEVLDALAADLPRLAVVHHPHNRGYGAALITGFATASRPWIFYTDGDAQYDASEVAVLVSAVTPHIDIAQGYKIGRGDPWYRIVIGRVYHHVVKAMFALPGRDTDCDFRLFRRALLDQAPLRSTSGVICVEMMRKFHRAGARFVEVPVHHYTRPHGRSQFFRLPHIARSCAQLLALWVRLVVLRRSS
jgi:glycosyltransferase involved in cell wall biosynthesis